MAKTGSISGQERQGAWHVRQASAASISNSRNGTELQPMIVAALRQAGAGSLATQIEGLTVAVASGYDSGALRRWSIETARGGKFIAAVGIKLASGEDKITGDYERDSFSSIKDAVAWVATELGHPAFASQIAAL